MSSIAPRLRRFALSLALFGVGCAHAPDGAVEVGRAARGVGGVVASAHPEASKAGLEVLTRGGNAVDAAIATAYALAVVEPYSAGLGGGGFLLSWDAAAERAHVVDYREVAPAAAHRDLYVVDGVVDSEASLVGIRAVAVPGMVPGLAAAQARFGRLGLGEVVPAAIRLAREGFEVHPVFHRASTNKREMLLENPAAAQAFLRPDGTTYAVGEVLRQPDLARTLEDLAAQGPRLFTHGRVARAIAEESARLGGLITLEDLERFAPRFPAPLLGAYRGHRVITMPPPSSGGTHLLQMLEMLEIDRAQRGRADDRGVEDTHYLVEIMRRAYADRAVYMGDPAFVDVPLEELLDPAYLARRYEGIGPRATRSASVSAGRLPGRAPPPAVPRPKEPRDTTHLTVVDAEGNVVSLTQTVNYGFGAGVVVPGTGILLNDEMDDFSAAPGVPNVFGLVGAEANAIAPGKIPLSSMTPTIVLAPDGELAFALGSPGGSTIITTVLQVILNVIDHGMPLPAAIAQPRIHMQWRPDETRLEPEALTEQVRSGLEARGHRLAPKARGWGNATGVQAVGGAAVGAADPRGDGAAAAR